MTPLPLAVLGLMSAMEPVVKADLVVRNARIVTVDPARPEARALAVAGGRFLAVGDEETVLRHRGAKTRLFDARGAVVIPGLIDAHLHLLGEGEKLRRLDLVGTRSKAEVLERVGREAAVRPPGAWIRGRGWDQNDWDDRSFPSASDLDAVAPGHPVALTRIDGHALWVNGRALASAGIDAATAEPPGGRILRGADGRPSGILVDNAADLVLKKLPPPTREERREAALLAARECVAAGLTGVHEPGLGAEDVEVLHALCREGKLPLRVYVLLEPGEALDSHLARGPQVGLCDGRLTVRGFKLYADGALGSRGAALLEDYADEPGHRGLLVTPPEEIERIVRKGAAAGFQPAIHAIGDRANRIVLDLFARLSPSLRAAVRPRIEHAQHVDPADLDRFAELGVVASMQPTHATSDLPWAGTRLGRSRLAGAYAWKPLLARAARLAFGSDAPVESVRPLWGIYAARTLEDHAGRPAGPPGPPEPISGAEALAAFTMGAAWAAFEEGERGSITPGKRADFVVLPEDPRTVEARRLIDMPVLSTWVGGERVWGTLD